MDDWESCYREWAKPPGKTEEQKCSNAESAIRNAINASDTLKNRNIHVFSQGSYRNNTNVRKNSDVDVGILCKDTFFYKLPEGYDKDSFGIIPSSYHYSQYKNEVEQALQAYFGSHAVSRGNKAFDVHQTSYHVEADVAPFFEHRRYHPDGQYISGVELLPDNGGQVINWPEQHYSNGVDKNNATGRRYKAMVRILKAINIQIEEQGYTSVLGFLIECLVWNIPNHFFGNYTYSEDLRGILTYLYKKLGTDESNEWGEVSELNYLFHSNQKWTKEQAREFTLKAWKHVGL